jgi:hypothetical protein
MVYAAIRGIKYQCVLQHVWTLTTLRKMKKISHERPHVVGFHLSEIFTRAGSTQTESRLMFDKGCRTGNRSVTGNGNWVAVVQLCACAKIYFIVHSKGWILWFVSYI